MSAHLSKSFSATFLHLCEIATAQGHVLDSAQVKITHDRIFENVSSVNVGGIWHTPQALRASTCLPDLSWDPKTVQRGMLGSSSARGRQA